MSLMLTAVFTGCSDSSTSTVPTVKPTEPKYVDKNGIGYIESKDGTLTVSTFKGDKKDLKIPSEYKGKKIKEVGRSSFKMTKLKSVTIPDTVTNIDAYAFGFSRDLEKVIIPDSVKNIESNAFSGCIKLSGVKLPKKLKTIGTFSFDATALKNVTIPKSVKKVSEYAFAECKDLKKVTFNGSDTEIADNAFDRSINVSVTAPKNSKAIKFAKSKGIDYKIK